jgi:hypothetical protein
MNCMQKLAARALGASIVTQAAVAAGPVGGDNA